MGFQLTSENYYSDIANYEYMSVSQFKDFAGTYGKLGCEECAMAKIRGKYKEPDRTALLEGSYVDSFYEGTLDTGSGDVRSTREFRKTGNQNQSDRS